MYEHADAHGLLALTERHKVRLMLPWCVPHSVLCAVQALFGMRCCTSACHKPLVRRIHKSALACLQAHTYSYDRGSGIASADDASCSDPSWQAPMCMNMPMYMVFARVLWTPPSGTHRKAQSAVDAALVCALFRSVHGTGSVWNEMLHKCLP